MKCENIKCNKEHDGSYGSGRFCSVNCANSRKHSQETKNKTSISLGGKGDKRTLNKFCINCGKELNKNSKKYCSIKCHTEYDYKTYIKNWKNGKLDGRSGKSGTSKQIKRYIWKKFNGRCSECGWRKPNPITKKPFLDLEHIDGDYKNNDEDNLTLLCPNCHSLTPTYKSLNRGNGRNSRYKY